MLATLSLAEIDQLLDELESLARSTASRQRFFGSALDRLKFLLETASCAIMLRTNSQQWVAVAHLGEPSPDSYTQLLRHASAELDTVHSPDGSCLAVPINPAVRPTTLPSSQTPQDVWQRGALLVGFAEPPGESEISDVIRICQAFGEILSIRLSAERDALVDEKWMGFQKSLVNLAASRSIHEAGGAIVNDLAALTCSDRVTLVRADGLGRGKALAISGVAQFEPRAAQVAAIESLGVRAIQQRKPFTDYSRLGNSQSADPVSVGAPNEQQVATGFANRVCLPVIAPTEDGPHCDTALLFEWEKYEAFLDGCTVLNTIMPAFGSVWQQQQRWLKIPKLQRALAEQPSFRASRRWSKRMTRWAMLLLLCGLAFSALWLPVRLLVEAKGTLQPLEQRLIHSANDGVVDAIFVQDGQLVEPGQPLIQLRSAMLEVDIQEVVGEIDANAKKRDGLNIAINRINRNDPSAASTQSRLSAEVSELVTQHETLELKLKALREQELSLLIKAPMDGMVVARHLERYLNDRPVRRGESLMRVVRLDGPWQLELLIPDRDAGYVKRRVFGDDAAGYGDVPEARQVAVDFVLASQPDIHQSARVTWLSESARNATGEGMMVDVWARAEKETVAAAHMGATVYASFDCGRAPFWFVWSRPFVESIQRRVWF